VNKSSE